MSLLLLFAGSGPQGVVVIPPPAVQSAPGGSGHRPIHVGNYEVFGYSERRDRDDDDVIAAVLSLL